MNMRATGDLDQIDDLDWSVRTAVYSFITEQTRPPTVDEAAALLGVTHERAALAFQRLNQRHALFLEPGTLDVRMAHPFSARPTPFRVHVGTHAYYANCAWDMLGIPAALHADAQIEAIYTDTGERRIALRFREGNNRRQNHDWGAFGCLDFQLERDHQQSAPTLSRAKDVAEIL